MDWSLEMSKKENINVPRGTYDLFTSKMAMRQDVVNTLFDFTSTYGFEQIQTPIFERSELFVRAVGEETDVVSKEMYDFLDKKGRNMSLRPELKAPIVRSYIENKFYATMPLAKFAYYGPAFRYERPQAGRFRQFHQFGIECLGLKSPSLDAELIGLAMGILKIFDLQDNVELKINTLGTNADRINYVQALKTYLNDYQDQMCSDCQTRINTNPLRVLDCKIDNKKDYFKNIPKLIDYLNEESITYFEHVKGLLDAQDIAYTIDDNLVRGLDYYNDVVFEIVHNTSKAQNAIIGGGRYDNLVTQLGGPETSAFGFGMGIERFIDALMNINPQIEQDYQKGIDVVYMPLCDEAVDIAIVSMNKLRCAGIKCETTYSAKSMKAHFKIADKYNAVYAVIIGEDEIKNNTVVVKNLMTKEENKVNINEFEEEFIKGDEHDAH